MKCPRCGFEQGPSAECISCGIVFEKWEARQQEQVKEVTPPAATNTDTEVSTPPQPALLPMFSRARRKIVYESIARLLDAGMSVTNSLAVLQESTTGAMSAYCIILHQRSLEGHPFSELARHCPRLFNPADVQLLHAAERTGDIPAALRSLCEQIEAEMEFRQSILRSAAYPVLLVVMAIVVLPIPIIIFQSMSAYLWAVGINLSWFVLFLFCVFWGLPWLATRQPLKAHLQKLAWRLPWPASIYVRKARESYTRVLCHNLRAGLPIYESLQSAAIVSDDPIVHARSQAIAEMIGEGAQLSSALAANSLLASGDIMLVAAGEKSGELPDALEQISIRYTAEVHRKTATLLRVGALVFFLAAAVFVANGIIDSYRRTMGPLQQIVGGSDHLEQILPAGDLEKLKKHPDMKKLKNALEEFNREKNSIMKPIPTDDEEDEE